MIAVARVKAWLARLVQRLRGQAVVCVGMAGHVDGQRQMPLGFTPPFAVLRKGESAVFRSRVSRAFTPVRLIVAPESGRFVVTAISPDPLRWPAGTDVAITVLRVT